MTGIIKKTEVQRLKMIIDQRDSQIEALKRTLDTVTAQRDALKAKAEKTPAQLHADRVAQLISEDRE